MTTPTDEQVVERVANAVIKGNGHGVAWLNNSEVYALVRAVIAEMRAIEREAAESKRAMWCATEGTYD